MEATDCGTEIIQVYLIDQESIKLNDPGIDAI